MYIRLVPVATDEEVSLYLTCFWLDENPYIEIHLLCKGDLTVPKIEPALSAVFQWMCGKSITAGYMSGIEELIVVAQIFWRNILFFLLPLFLCIFLVSKVSHWFSTIFLLTLIPFVDTLYQTWYGKSLASVVGIWSKQNYAYPSS